MISWGGCCFNGFYAGSPQSRVHLQDLPTVNRSPSDQLENAGCEVWDSHGFAPFVASLLLVIRPGAPNVASLFRSSRVLNPLQVPMFGPFDRVIRFSFWAIGLSATQAGAKLYVTAIACLAYGLAQYNEMVRCTVASAGNDHRLGAQEAPPAIISLYPGWDDWAEQKKANDLRSRSEERTL